MAVRALKFFHRFDKWSRTWLWLQTYNNFDKGPSFSPTSRILSRGFIVQSPLSLKQSGCIYIKGVGRLSRPERAFCRLTFGGGRRFSSPKFPSRSEGTKWWIIFFRQRRRRRMSDERANNWARLRTTNERHFQTENADDEQKIWARLPLSLNNNPSSHNGDQRYKNGIDLGCDKGRK